MCRGKDRVQTCSVTIVVPHGDIPWALYDAACSFVREQCRAGCMSTERGDAFKHLHVQGVLKKRSTSSVKVKHELAAWLAEHVDGYADLHCSLCVKKATNKGLHTWEGLIGYTRKGKGREEYREFLHNITPLELEEGEHPMRLHGSALKHRVALTQHNILERAVAYREYELRGRLKVSLAAIVYAMIASAQYYFDAGWAVPYQGQGMDSTRAEVVWLSACMPLNVSLGGVAAVLFKEGAVTASRLSFAGVPVSEVERDDGVLQQLVEDARVRGVTVGSLVDARPAVRELLYERNTQVRRSWRGQQELDAAAQLQVFMDTAANELRTGEQLRWHVDLLHHDQPMHGLDSDSNKVACAVSQSCVFV